MIIGVSSKFSFNKWKHNVYIFDSKEAAEKWLNTEEYDFRERELFTDMKQAVQLVGIEPVVAAIEGKEPSNGQTWKALRKAYNLTQAGMSAITDIPKRTIENWENDKRNAPEYMLNLVECKLKEWDNAKKFGK